MTRDEAPAVGVVYDVELNDCCVKGRFIARLDGVAYYDDSPHDEDRDLVAELQFSNDVVLTEFLAVVLTPLGDQVG